MGDPASVTSGIVTDLRGWFFLVELRLQAGEERPSSGQGGKAVRCRGSQGCGGHGLGEVFRQGQPRLADGETLEEDRRQASAPPYPPVS